MVQRRWTRPPSASAAPPSQQWITCPQCGKRAYATRKIARSVARRLPPREDGAVLRAYQCRDGDGIRRFHIGHVNPAFVQRDLNAPPHAPCCPTSCKPECTAACHESHAPWQRREHQPRDCPAWGVVEVVAAS